ncbi:MAG: response regulator [Akkermansiaceae bacterium]|nr:response regulator [Akkermansiaceae bacterium]
MNEIIPQVPNPDGAVLPQQVASTLKKADVLVVDDSRMMRAALGRSLRELGFSNISEAVDGADAVNKLLEKPYDLMLLDMEMPVMNGMEVLAAMRLDSRLSGVPVIVISAADQIEKAVQCIEAGAEDYLPKPPALTLLRARVTTALEKKRLRDLERLRFAQLQAEKELVELEKEKSEKLLLNILPGAIAGRLKSGEKTIANGHATVSVMFADLCGFTALSRKTNPAQLVEMLNGIFTAFDLIVEKHGVEKIKTIGDCYMMVGGLPTHRDDHAQVVADAALEMVQALDRLNQINGTDLKMRVGIHTGPVVAGVIGKIKFTYDLWGDTVNVASRMESSGLPGMVHLSEQTQEALKGKFMLEERGFVECKGLGQVKTFFLKGREGQVIPV